MLVFLDHIQQGSVKFPISNFYRQKEGKIFKSKPAAIHFCSCLEQTTSEISSSLHNSLCSWGRPGRNLQGAIPSADLKHRPQEVTDSLPLTPSAQGCYTEITPDPVFCDARVSLPLHTSQSSSCFQMWASSNTCRWRNILGICWPKGVAAMMRSVSEMRQFHGLRCIFLLLPPDYGSLRTGFSVPIQAHNSLPLLLLDPEVSLVQGQLPRHPENTAHS